MGSLNKLLFSKHRFFDSEIVPGLIESTLDGNRRFVAITVSHGEAKPANCDKVFLGILALIEYFVYD